MKSTTRESVQLRSSNLDRHGNGILNIKYSFNFFTSDIFSVQFEAKEEQLKATHQQVEGLKSQISHKDRQVNELQEKFLQSSVHIMEETLK